MKLKEYEGLKIKAKADYQQKLEAIELVWSMTKKQENSRESQPARGIAKAVREFVENSTNAFSVVNIEDSLKPAYGDKKRGAISTAIQRMIDKEIKIKEKGYGRNPSLYVKILPTA